jgi:hypothetical protein
VFTASGGCVHVRRCFNTCLCRYEHIKTFLVTTALVAAVCVPVGYHLSTGGERANSTNLAAQTRSTIAPSNRTAPNFENSALFAEWRALHDKHGTNAAAMPALYKEIADMKDAFRRRAFRAALIAEWVQVDPTGGFDSSAAQAPTPASANSSSKSGLRTIRTPQSTRSFQSSWLGRHGPRLSSEIARRAPSRVAEITSALPEPESYWSTSVRDAFAILAQGGLSAARTVAEKVTGPNRAQASAASRKSGRKAISTPRSTGLKNSLKDWIATKSSAQRSSAKPRSIPWPRSISSASFRPAGGSTTLPPPPARACSRKRPAPTSARPSPGFRHTRAECPTMT